MAPPGLIWVDIEFSKQKYLAGETIEGIVTVTFPQAEHVLETLSLEVSGTESSHVPVADSPGIFTPVEAGGTGALACVSDHRSIFEYCQVLADLRNKALESGKHSWPFATVIPAGAPATQKTGNVRGQDMWEVSYEAKARLTFNADNKNRGTFGKTSPIRVWCQPRAHVHTPPKVVGPEASPVRSLLFWKKSRSVTLALKVEKTTFTLGEPVEVSILVLNPGSVAFKHVDIELVQVTEWEAKGRPSHAKKVLASKTVQTSELHASLGREFLDADGAGLTAVSSSGEEQKEFDTALLGSMSGAFEIPVPEQKLDHFLDASGLGNVGLVTKLNQFVRLRLKTGKGSKSPVLSCDIQVVNNMQ